MSLAISCSNIGSQPYTVSTPRNPVRSPRNPVRTPPKSVQTFFLQICIDLINTKLNFKNLDVREQKRYLIIIGVYQNSSRDNQFREFCLGASEVLNIYIGGKEMGGMIVDKKKGGGGKKQGEGRKVKGRERKEEVRGKKEKRRGKERTNNKLSGTTHCYFSNMFQSIQASVYTLVSNMLVYRLVYIRQFPICSSLYRLVYICQFPICSSLQTIVYI